VDKVSSFNIYLVVFVITYILPEKLYYMSHLWLGLDGFCDALHGIPSEYE
jgi:hypothetical protein